MMCRHSLDLPQVADAIEKAVEQVLVDGYRTGDIYREGLKTSWYHRNGTSRNRTFIKAMN